MCMHGASLFFFYLFKEEPLQARIISDPTLQSKTQISTPNHMSQVYGKSRRYQWGLNSEHETSGFMVVPSDNLKPLQLASHFSQRRSGKERQIMMNFLRDAKVHHAS